MNHMLNWNNTQDKQLQKHDVYIFLRRKDGGETKGPKK